MKLKSQACEALSLLFQKDRVPPAITYDNDKEMIQDEFNTKLKEGSCNLRHTKPFIPWLNAAEVEIKTEERLWKENDQI